jgi:hypothetical protein
VEREGRSERRQPMLAAVFWTAVLVGAWVPWVVAVVAEME